MSQIIDQCKRNDMWAQSRFTQYKNTIKKTRDYIPINKYISIKK